MRSMLLGGMVATVLALPAATQAQEARGDFAQTLRDIRQGVFLVGSPRVGTGTAWVISKKHRLLATNAHVADFFSKVHPNKMLAMMNGSEQTYTVERVWYHPGVKRYASPDQNLSVRASNPKFGEVDPACPDVAVIQLSSEGPDLPVELKLADPKVVFDLQGLPAAILGFPGHDTTGWPQPDRSAQATFHNGVVSRLSDFQYEGGVRAELAQMLQYTMQSFGGFSGSPVFMPSGEVIGLHNSARSIDKSRVVAHGIRIDALWELLVHCNLDDRVAVPMDKDKLLIKRWLETDPNMEKFNALTKLMNEADTLIYNKEEFAAGIEKCNEAVKLYGKYAPAYRTRCDGYNNWEFNKRNVWPAEKRIQILKLALADAERYIDLHRSVPVDAMLTNIVVLNNLGSVTGIEKYNLIALDVASKILGQKGASNDERARALSSKAIALSNLGRPQDARVTHEQAIQANPESPSIWDSRASFMENNGSPAQARSDRAVGKALRKRDLLLSQSERKDFKVISKVEEKLTRDDPADGRGRFQQLWTVDMVEGYYYQIDLKNPAFKNAKDFDPILRLSDDANRTIQEDDDSGGLPNARIFFTPAKSGTYKLYVTSYLPGQTGPFVLTVTRIAKEK